MIYEVEKYKQYTNYIILLLLLLVILIYTYLYYKYVVKSSNQKGGCAALCMLPLLLL